MFLKTSYKQCPHYLIYHFISLFILKGPVGQRHYSINVLLEQVLIWSLIDKDNTYSNFLTFVILFPQW